MTIRAARLSDARAIAAIYNAGIAEGGATFETAPRSAGDIAERLAAADRYPIVVSEDAGGRVTGWAAVSAYRARNCYAGVGEFSVYVAPDCRGQRLGRRLLDAVVDAARDAGYWKLVSRVFPFNQASRRACLAAGFREVGTYEKHGFANGAWQDVIIVERLIPGNLTAGGLRLRRAHDRDWPAIERLLISANLPRDGARDHLRDFVVALRDDAIVGCAAIERAGEAAVLLRSVALDAAERGSGAGRALVERVLDHAGRSGASSAVLLTTTAEAFFTHLGFQRISREDVPASLLGSAEFRGVCPASAVVMCKAVEEMKHVKKI